MVAGAMVMVRCGQDETRAGTAPPPIELRGTVRAAQATTLVAQVDGVVGDITAREGGGVAAGAAILQLANPAVDRDAEVAAAQLALIDARLRRSGRPAPRAPVASRQTLDITARILELRKARLDKMQSLRGTNDVTAGDLQQAEVEYLAALRDFNNERRGPVPGPSAADDSEILRLERQRIVADQKFAAHRQSLLAIRSPFAGVLTRLHVTQGQPVYVRDPIADVADLSNLQVRAGISPDLLRYVRPGMRVDVKILSTPVRTFADEIDAIVPATQAAGTEPGLPSVVITVPNPDASLQPNTEAIITLRSVQ